MSDFVYEWRPGSFTKNYSWGKREAGLRELHQSIRIGFADEMSDVPRVVFRERHAQVQRPDFIPINFFLFNYQKDGQDFVLADELVFQALSFDHSPRFDKLALFALNFSFAGRWNGARPFQRRPALWAHHYVRERVAGELHWDTSKVDADDIERFLSESPEYTGQTTRKLSTNLNYLYSVGGLRAFQDKRVDRWWVDALFLALDRLIEDRRLDGLETSERGYDALLSSAGFKELSGAWSTEKRLATRHLLTLYSACGGRERFCEELVKERTLALPDVAWLLANDPRPRGAVHPTNPRVLKSIPRACAFLARYAGFEEIGPDELENFDAEAFVRRHTIEALQRLNDRGVRPGLPADQVEELTRE